ncbi:MAG: MraY family glycosyltransferase [bacterium]|nr:MraY family glycosyltransferase [bacterium]
MFNHKTYLFFFLSAFAGCLFLTPWVRKLALRLNIVDDPGVRKRHERAMPTLGGLSIFLVFMLLVGSCLVFENRVTVKFLEKGRLVAGILVCGLIAVLLGIYDDVKGADAKKKFSVQIAAAMLAFALGFRIEGVSLGPLGSVNMGAFSFLFTLLWIVGITNAVNIIDGIDGLAAGVALFVCIGNFVVSLVLGNVVMSVISAILAGALLGFLRYNFPPAKIFLGNTGSLFLGMVLALVSLISAQKSSTMVMMLIPIAVLGLPILDTSLAILRRSLLGRPVFVSDKGHIHHALLRLGMKQKRAVMILYGFCLLLLGFAALVVLEKSTVAAVWLGALGLVFLVGMRVLGYLNYEKIRKSLCNRWRFRAKNAFCRYLLLKMSKVQTVDGLWELLTQAAREFEIDDMELSLNGGADDSVLRWTNGAEHGVPGEAWAGDPQLKSFDFPEDLGRLTLHYAGSRDEESELERHQRLEMISHAVEKRLGAILKFNAIRGPAV